MSEVSEYRAQIEAIQKRLNGSNGHGGEEIGELKERLGAIRSSLLRKQEIIDEQKREIESLREEKAQLSELLGQALSALNEPSKDGLKEIVQSFDSELSGLLGDAEPEAAAADDPNPKSKDGSASKQARPGDGVQRKPSSSDEPGQAPPAGETAVDWEPENDSPALRRILGRRRR